MDEFNTIDIIIDSSVANGSAVVNRDAPEFTLLPPIEDVIGMSVISVQVPFTYYIIDNTCDQFVVTITGPTNGGGGTDYNGGVYTVTIPLGTYTSVNLPPMLNYCMQTASQVTKVGGVGAATELGTVIGMTTLIDNTTSAILFYVSGALYRNQTPFTISFLPATSAADVLGFSSAKASTTGVVNDNSDVPLNGGSSTNYLYSQNSVQLSGPPYLYLHSNLASTSHQAVRNSTNSTDIIAAIEVNNNYQGTIDYSPQNPQKISFSKTSISNLNFYFTMGTRLSFDTTGYAKRYLELQGQPFFMRLRFYKSDASKSTYVMNNLGDKYVSEDSVSTGAKRPNQQMYKPKNIFRKSS